MAVWRRKQTNKYILQYYCDNPRCLQFHVAVQKEGIASIYFYKWWSDVKSVSHQKE